MVVAQKVEEAEITEQDSVLLTRNLLRIAIYNISYIRGLFPEKYFNDKSVPALEMKMKQLMSMDEESRRLIDWMEKGIYDALQKKYLNTILFCICEKAEGPMIEEYSFSFSYPKIREEEVQMNMTCNGNKKSGATFKSETSDVTPDQMRCSACKMVRTLVSLMRTLDQMPQERTIIMKPLYYDEVTPEDYEPPFFRGCMENEAVNLWNRNPLRMEVGSVNSKHLVLALKVKSVLDPCKDENGDAQGDDTSLDDGPGDEKDSSDSEGKHERNGDAKVPPKKMTNKKQKCTKFKGGQRSQGATILKLLMFLSLVGCISAKKYTVGGDLGWRVPADINFYNRWTRGYTFVTEDALVFRYEVDQLLLLGEKDYKICNISNAITASAGGITKFVLWYPGCYYFSTSNVKNCLNGQKLAINVSLRVFAPPLPLVPTPSPAPPPSPTPSAALPPIPPPPSSPPPPPNSESPPDNQSGGSVSGGGLGGGGIGGGVIGGGIIGGGIIGGSSSVGSQSKHGSPSPIGSPSASPSEKSNIFIYEIALLCIVVALLLACYFVRLE